MHQNTRIDAKFRLDHRLNCCVASFEFNDCENVVKITLTPIYSKCKNDLLIAL